MGRPITLQIEEDLAALSGGVNILRAQADRTLQEPSLVVVYMNREDTDVQAQIKIGTTEVMPLGGSAIQALAGVVPRVPDDNVLISMGKKNEEVQILGTNANAALRELRVQVKIFALADIAKWPAIVGNI